MSSRIAVCGQAPVSTAVMRSGGQHRVAQQELGVLAGVDVVGDHGDRQLSRSARHSAATVAVLPEPTGPPMPMRSARRVPSGRSEQEVALGHR
jgi:hypothetical protein